MLLCLLCLPENPLVKASQENKPVVDTVVFVVCCCGSGIRASKGGKTANTTNHNNHNKKHNKGIPAIENLVRQNSPKPNNHNIVSRIKVKVQ